MCEVCAIFGAGEHWSDFGRMRNERFPFDDIMHFREERRRRIGLINELIGSAGATCEDWDGEALVIVDRQGRSQIAQTLTDLWPVVEKLTGARVDPLAVTFLTKDQNV